MENKQPDEIDKRYEDEKGGPLSVDAKDTDREWQFILALCKRNYSIGFGFLDSFLSGPDIEKRVNLVKNEAFKNESLRLELRDTMSLDQSKNLTPLQIKQLEAVVGLVR